MGSIKAHLLRRWQSTEALMDDEIPKFSSIDESIGAMRTALGRTCNGLHHLLHPAAGSGELDQSLQSARHLYRCLGRYPGKHRHPHTTVPEFCAWVVQLTNEADQHATPHSLRPTMDIHAIEKQLDLPKIACNRPTEIYPKRYDVRR